MCFAVQERAGKSVAEMAALAAEVLHDTPYTVDEVAHTLGLPVRCSFNSHRDRIAYVNVCLSCCRFD